MLRRISSLCLILVAATTAAVAQAPAAVDAKAATSGSQRHFLWMVRNNSGPPTYLLGSLHLLSAEYYPLAPAIESAFTQATVLIEEIDIDEVTNPAVALPLIGKAMFMDGRTLDQVIAPELYKQVVARAEKAGVPVEALQRMKPWMAAASLTLPSMQAAGFNTEMGVDKHFFDRAKKAGLERRALETVAYQFDRLDQMAPPLQEAMLRAVIADLDTKLSSVKTIADGWARGDVATLERLLLGAMRESPELYERLLVERNRNWVAPVEACLSEKKACLVVVGAAHLVGPHSLVTLLQQRGHTVEQR
jgi:uncharacterized protein YbaP (TraB family)